MRPRALVFGAVAALSLALDQASKVWARRALLPIYPQVKTVIAGYWDFRYSENPGGAFGFLRTMPGAQWLLVAAAAAVAIGAVIYLRRAAPPRHPLVMAAALGLVVGGALGNAVDRAVFHHVTDFVVWKIGTHEWDTFNVADAALVVGIIGLLLTTGRPRAGDARKAARAA